MRQASLAKIVDYCNRILRIAQVNDYDGALNGLQVQNNGRITRIAAAVDASLATAKLAVDAGADLLIVHHGLFWSPRQPWTGANYRLFEYLLKNNLSVYSAHLPLDLHPKLGNNAQLCRALGFYQASTVLLPKESAYRLQRRPSRFPAHISATP